MRYDDRVLVEHHAEDRRRYDRQILQTFVVTMAGFWLTVLIWIWVITPIFSSGVWPLLEPAAAKTGRMVPEKEHDVWVTIRANGEIFVDENKVDVVDLSNAGETIFVRVDRAAPFSAVRTVVREAQRAHRRTLTFMVRSADRRYW